MSKQWFDNNTWSVGNWCAFRRVVRTNNDIEGWHLRINNRAAKSNLNLYLLIPFLHWESSMVGLQLQLVVEQSFKIKYQKMK